jgi:hypothetical protein
VLLGELVALLGALKTLADGVGFIQITSSVGVLVVGSLKFAMFSVG